MLHAQTLHNTDLVNNSNYRNLNSEFQWCWCGGLGCCYVMEFGFFVSLGFLFCLGFCLFGGLCLFVGCWFSCLVGLGWLGFFFPPPEFDNNANISILQATIASGHNSRYKLIKSLLASVLSIQISHSSLITLNQIRQVMSFKLILF